MSASAFIGVHTYIHAVCSKRNTIRDMICERSPVPANVGHLDELSDADFWSLAGACLEELERARDPEVITTCGGRFVITKLRAVRAPSAGCLYVSRDRNMKFGKACDIIRDIDAGELRGGFLKPSEALRAAVEASLAERRNVKGVLAACKDASNPTDTLFRGGSRV